MADSQMKGPLERPALAFYLREGETEDRQRKEAPGSWQQSRA